jgi:hypothetical protein
MRRVRIGHPRDDLGGAAVGFDASSLLEFDCPSEPVGSDERIAWG